MIFTEIINKFHTFLHRNIILLKASYMGEEPLKEEELMLLIYLVLEKNIINLPNQITNNENSISYNLFRNEENLVYHILRSLSRKADVRNFLCSILLDSLNNLQGIRNYLSLNPFFSKEKSEKNVEDNNANNLLNNTIE